MSLLNNHKGLNLLANTIFNFIIVLFPFIKEPFLYPASRRSSHPLKSCKYPFLLWTPLIVVCIYDSKTWKNETKLIKNQKMVFKVFTPLHLHQYSSSISTQLLKKQKHSPRTISLPFDRIFFQKFEICDPLLWCKR